MPISFRLLLLGGFLSAATQHTQAQATASANNTVYTYVEQMPAFPGGQSAMFESIGNLINYPTEALQQRLEGRVFVGLVVGTSGRVQDVKVSKGVHPLLDAEAVRAVSNMPAFEPGMQNGRPVPVAYTVPITFKLPADVDQLLAERAAAKAAAAATHDARFVGGPEALHTFLLQAPYPEAARASQAEGRVFVRFEVAPDGTVGKVAAIVSANQPKRRKLEIQAPLALSSNPLLVRAAEQHIAALPAWEPAKRDGVAVASTQTMPVDFRLIPPAAPETAYAYADQMPVFPGGTAGSSLLPNLARSTRYPPEALRGRIQGEVLVYFVVGENGQVEQTQIIRSVHSSLDAEALRVVKAQQASAPGLLQGKPVKVFYVVPLNFAIK